MERGATCVVCSKPIDTAVDRPVRDRKKWFCSDLCWQNYLNKVIRGRT